MKHNYLIRIHLVALAIVLSLVSGPVLARTTKLVEPPPVTIQCHLSEADMIDAIVSGGSLRGWRPVTRAPGLVELRYIKGANKHVITVNVEYTKNTFDVTYKDSTNLNYKVKKNGARVIHPRPIGWMTNLSMDIESRTFALCAR